MPAPKAMSPAATSALLFAGRLGGAMLAAEPEPPTLGPHQGSARQCGCHVGGVACQH